MEMPNRLQIVTLTMTLTTIVRAVTMHHCRRIMLLFLTALLPTVMIRFLIVTPTLTMTAMFKVAAKDCNQKTLRLFLRLFQMLLLLEIAIRNLITIAIVTVIVMVKG